MALKKCKECGNEVSSKAKECPSCGHPVAPEKTGCATYIVVAIFIFIGITVFTGGNDTANGGSVATVKTPTQSQLTLSNEAHTLLSAKSLEDQAFFLGYAARSAGMECPNGSARKPFFQGFDSEQSAYWNITCGKEAYTVMLQNDTQGSSSTTPCSLLKTLGVVCYTKFD